MNLPQQVKYTGDGAAAVAAFAHFWGVWEGHVASVASTVAIVWIGIQAYFFIKDRWGKK